jgi:hypothetical protein
MRQFTKWFPIRIKIPPIVYIFVGFLIFISIIQFGTYLALCRPKIRYIFVVFKRYNILLVIKLGEYLFLAMIFH